MRQVLFTEPRQFAPRGKGLITRAAGGWLYVLVCPSWEGMIHSWMDFSRSSDKFAPRGRGLISEYQSKHPSNPVCPSQEGMFLKSSTVKS